MKNKSKLALFAFIPVTILCFFVRAVQYAYAVDLQTGFFKDDAGFLRYSTLLVLALGFVIIVSLTILDKIKNSKAFVRKTDQFSPTYIKVFGFLLLISAATIGIKLPEAISGGRKMYPLFAAMLFGTIILAATGIYALAKKRFDRYFALLLSGVAIYVALRAGMLFLSLMVVSSVSQYVLEILSRVSIVYFLFSFGRIILNAERKFTRVLTVISGLFSSLLIFTTELGAFAAIFFTDLSQADLIASPNAENLFMGVFELFAVIMLYCSPLLKIVETTSGVKATIQNTEDDLTEGLPDIDDKIDNEV